MPDGWFHHATVLRDLVNIRTGGTDKNLETKEGELTTL